MTPSSERPSAPSSAKPSRNVVSPASGRWLLAIVMVGLVLQIWLWQRGRLDLHAITGDSEVRAVELCGIQKYDRESFTRDQVHLLTPAVERAMGGPLLPFSKRMSGGSVVPGSLLQILIGEPLKAVFDYRASSVGIVLMHGLAGWLVFATARAVQGPQFAMALFMLFWLSPWRLYHGGFLWEPAFIVLPSALHLWAHSRLWTGEPRWMHPGWWSLRKPLSGAVWPSFFLALALSTAPQLHGSAVILFLISGGLLVTGRCRVYGPAFVGGLVVGSATLIPTLVAWQNGSVDWVDESNTATVGHGPFRWLYRLPRAFGYWIRLGSLDVGRRYRQTELFHADAPWWSRAVGISVAFIALVTALVTLWICFQWLKGRLTVLDRESFFSRYALTTLGAVLISAAVSPVTLQGWHVLVALPACLVAPAAWLCGKLTSYRGRLVLLAAQVTCTLLIGFGHPMYEEPVPGPCRVLWTAEGTLPGS